MFGRFVCLEGYHFGFLRCLSLPPTLWTIGLRVCPEARRTDRLSHELFLSMESGCFTNVITNPTLSDLTCPTIRLTRYAQRGPFVSFRPRTILAAHRSDQDVQKFL